MTTRTVTIGGTSFEVAPFSLGRLRKLIPLFNRVAFAFGNGSIDDAVFGELLEILGLAIGRTPAELEEMPSTMAELMKAFETIADVAGLKPVEGDAGNA
jgi:hypothetical protein